MCFRLSPAATALLLLLLPPTGRATPPEAGAAKVANVLPPLDPAAAPALAKALCGVLIQQMPSPLYEASPGWGATREFKTSLRWTGRRLESVRSPRNHGLWRKVKLTPLNIPNSLVFEVRDIRQPTPERVAFHVFLALDVRADIEQQRWQAGTRLYAASLEARMRVQLKLDCEAEADLDVKAGALPDVVFRLRVVRADVDYDNLVVEHLGGIGGTAARLLGEALRSGVRKLTPAVERGLLDRAGAAITRAAGTREVRVSLDRLLKGLLEKHDQK
jgi:hypothetical protein